MLVSNNALRSYNLSLMATCCRYMPRLDEGIKYAKEALDIAEHMHITYVKMITLDEIAWLLMLQNDLDNAKYYINQATNIANMQKHSAWMFLYVTVSEYHLLTGNPKESIKWASKAASLSMDYGFEYDLILSNNALAKGYIADNQFRKAEDVLNRIYSLSSFYGVHHSYTIQNQISLYTHMGNTAKVAEKEKELCEHFSKYHYLQPQSYSVAPTNAVHNLEISVLGEFKINGVNATAKINRTSSLRLLQLFICNYKYELSRDTITDAIFYSNNTNSKNHFNVSLSVLRKSLEPNLTQGSKSNFIIRKNGKYRLVCDNVYLDIAELEDLCDDSILISSEDRIPKLHKAEALYQGSLFEEYPNEPFLDGIREKYRLLYVSVLHELGNYYFNIGENFKGIDYYDKMLKEYPYLDDIYIEYISTLLKIKAFSKAKEVAHDMVNTLDPYLEIQSKSMLTKLFRDYGIMLSLR